jgi:hypothetical protein
MNQQWPPSWVSNDQPLTYQGDEGQNVGITHSPADPKEVANRPTGNQVGRDIAISRETTQGEEDTRGFDNRFGQDPQSDSLGEHSLTHGEVQLKNIQDDKNIDSLLSERFIEDIKIDFIPSIDFRIMCRFLNITSINDLKSHPYTDVTLKVYLLMSSIVDYMKEEGFTFAGELNYNQKGESIPPVKQVWKIRDKEISFTRCGYLFFDKGTGNKNDNVVIFTFSDTDQQIASMNCYSNDNDLNEKIITNLEAYSKNHNCLRGAKIKDINIFQGSFSVMDSMEEYTWNNFYYKDNVKDLFQLEVFDFLNNLERYNECGINKRGCLLHGNPGCVIEGTKIKIRKKKKEGSHKIINI